MIVETIHNKEQTKPVTSKAVISVQGLYKTFGKNNPVLQGLDLNV